MEQFETIDFSRESTETIAPFLTIVGVDSTFVSGIEVGRVNFGNRVYPDDNLAIVNRNKKWLEFLTKSEVRRGKDFSFPSSNLHSNSG